MVQSINSKVDLVMAGTSYMGLTDYGKIMCPFRQFIPFDISTLLEFDGRNFRCKGNIYPPFDQPT